MFKTILLENQINQACNKFKKLFNYSRKNDWQRITIICKNNKSGSRKSLSDKFVTMTTKVSYPYLRVRFYSLNSFYLISCFDKALSLYFELTEDLNRKTSLPLETKIRFKKRCYNCKKSLLSNNFIKTNNTVKIIYFGFK